MSNQEQTKQEKNIEKSTSEVNFQEMWQGLSHNQQRYAVAMLDAASKKEAALAIGIEPNTVYNWNGSIDDVVAYMRAETKDAAIEIITNNTVKAAMVKVAGLDSDDEKQRQDAASEVLDRSLGRPTQRQEHSGRDGGPIQTENVSKHSETERERSACAFADAIRAMCGTRNESGIDNVDTAIAAAVDGGDDAGG